MQLKGFAIDSGHLKDRIYWEYTGDRFEEFSISRIVNTNFKGDRKGIDDRNLPAVLFGHFIT